MEWGWRGCDGSAGAQRVAAVVCLLPPRVASVRGRGALFLYVNTLIHNAVQRKSPVFAQRCVAEAEKRCFFLPVAVFLRARFGHAGIFFLFANRWLSSVLCVSDEFF